MRGRASGRVEAEAWGRDRRCGEVKKRVGGAEGAEAGAGGEVRVRAVAAGGGGLVGRESRELEEGRVEGEGGARGALRGRGGIRKHGWRKRPECIQPACVYTLYIPSVTGVKREARCLRVVCVPRGSLQLDARACRCQLGQQPQDQDATLAARRRRPSAQAPACRRDGIDNRNRRKRAAMFLRRRRQGRREARRTSLHLMRTCRPLTSTSSTLLYVLPLHVPLSPSHIPPGAIRWLLRHRLRGPRPQ